MQLMIVQELYYAGSVHLPVRTHGKRSNDRSAIAQRLEQAPQELGGGRTTADSGEGLVSEG